LVTGTPWPKDTVVFGVKLVPVIVTTRPVAPCAAASVEMFVRTGPAAGETALAFFTDAFCPSRPGFGPNTVTRTSAVVTPSGRKPGATSTAIDEIFMLAGPCVDAAPSVKEIVVLEYSSTGELRTAPLLRSNVTTGCAAMVILAA